jgi:hypothetical protein
MHFIHEQAGRTAHAAAVAAAGRLRGDACRTLCAKFCVAVCLPALCRVQDTRFKWKTKLAGGAALTIKQHVPGGNWALIPNPGVPHCALLAAGCRPRAVQRGGGATLPLRFAAGYRQAAACSACSRAPCDIHKSALAHSLTPTCNRRCRLCIRRLPRRRCRV